MDRRLDGDHGLQQAIDATEYLINDALNLCQEGQVDGTVLSYLEQPEFGGGKLAQKRFGTFYAPRKPDTTEDYIRIWSSVLCYLWRTFDMDPAHRPRFTISERQRAAFEAFRDRAREEARGESRTVQTMTMGSCDSLIVDAARDVDQSMRLAAEFWLSIFADATPGDHNDNMLMSGWSVLAIKRDAPGVLVTEDDFDGPIESLPKMAAFIKVGKALVVWTALNERQFQIEGWIQAGESRTSAEQKAHSVLDRVKRRMDPGMKSVAFGGEANVLSKLNEMREYAQGVKERTEGRR